MLSPDLPEHQAHLVHISIHASKIHMHIKLINLKKLEDFCTSIHKRLIFCVFVVSCLVFVWAYWLRNKMGIILSSSVYLEINLNYCLTSGITDW